MLNFSTSRCGCCRLAGDFFMVRNSIAAVTVACVVAALMITISCVVAADEPTNLRVGDFGTQVEILQRTLNVRLQPSPELGVDGDFGRATEAAVKRFQESIGQSPTGVADASLWNALEPVVEESVVPAPEVVNAEVLPRLLMDAADGPPFVSCNSWIIVDAADGRTIAGHETMTPRPVASTTKIMTAWLLVRLADEHPEVLDEIITMSTRADEMRGSTAGLRAGESISVHEGLFGLLLPSGNDMSIALAEHFGVRLAAASAPATTEADPLCMFIAAMNAEAARLGMMETHFTNPHGLHEESHVSTANDLALLARATLASQSFRRYCSARQRGAVVHGPDGGARNVLWKNTNKLLATEGYDGIKTGTTEQAGACQVSTGERNGKRLIIVVLGSAASESCYTDARNLYRWGWQQLAAAVD
jgi:D-alanyl-D-alanine carboxypeptidase (penicillin-binding protein 5/6)